MSERIEFMEPVAVFILNRGWHVATALIEGRVELVCGATWGLSALDAPSQARIEAARKLALAHLDAQKIADKVEHYEDGCFAIDEYGDRWEFRDARWVRVVRVLWLHGEQFHGILRPTFYLPRPVEKRVSITMPSGAALPFACVDGRWTHETGEPIIDLLACALDLIWEQKQRIAELELKETPR